MRGDVNLLFKVQMLKVGPVNRWNLEGIEP